MFEDLIRRTLGDLSTEVKRKLINELEDLGKEFLVPKVADSVGRIVVKSIDGVAAAAVRTLPEEDAARLVAAYLVEVTEQLDQFSTALENYAPHPIAVEVAKKQFGSKSVQANLERMARKKWMDEVKGEARDVFRAIAGAEVED